MDTREDPGQYYPGGTVIPRTPVSGGGDVVLDDTVTESSQNGVKSSGIWSWVKGLLPSWLTSSFPRPITSHQDISGKLDKTGGVMTGALESSANGEISIVDQHGNTKYTKTGILRDKSVGGSTQINGLTLNFPDKSGTLAVTSEIPSVDSTLAVSGAASDAKKVGDKLKEKASAKVGASVVLKNGDGSILSLSTSDPTSASLGSLVYCFFLGTVDITGSVTSIAFNGETGKVVVTSSDSYPTLEFDVGSIEWGDSNIVHMATNLTPAGQTALFASAATSMQTSGSSLNAAAIAAITGANTFATLTQLNLFAKWCQYTIFDWSLAEDDDSYALKWRMINNINVDSVEESGEINTVEISLGSKPTGITGSGDWIMHLTTSDNVPSIQWSLSGWTKKTRSGTSWDEIGGNLEANKEYLFTFTEIGNDVLFITREELV